VEVPFMSQEAIVVLGYGLFILLGGIMGYSKAKSKASLGAGVLFGIPILIAGVLIGVEDLGRRNLGIQIAAALAALLTLLFLYRTVKTKKFMNVVLMLASIAVVVYLYRKGIPGLPF
jgi:uncharacterized membrane protein (UPF0136 family)